MKNDKRFYLMGFGAMAALATGAQGQRPNIIYIMCDDLNGELEKALRLEDFLVIAKMMAIDALNRNESCGAHFREEYQTKDGEAARNDKDYMYVSCWKYTGDEEKPILLKEPLKYESITVQTRNYKS